MLSDSDNINMNFQFVDTTNIQWYFNEAILTPGKQCKWYFTENGYQYCKKATWNTETKIMNTNWSCPVRFTHHVGSTCKVCGMKN